MSRTFGTLLDEQAASLAGRDRERAALLGLVERDVPLVAFVHGVGGAGKSALLRAFAADARARGASVVALDGRSIEPTEQGFMVELARALERDPGATGLGEALGGLGDRVVLTLDTLERLKLLEHWLRSTVLPSLPENVRVMLAGREAPAPGWLESFAELMLPLELGNLLPETAHAVLRRAGLDDDQSRRVNRLARGHPLSLQLAASASRSRPGVAFADATEPPLVDELARIFLAELDPDTRRALDAAAVVRRTTLSVLEAMLPGEDAAAAFERLRRLAFVELGRDGLVLHDTVREVLAAQLRAADPTTYRRLRTAAWRQLRREERQSATVDLWRYTADMLYLIENPLLREALFPVAQPMPVDRADPDDGEALAEISALHEPPTGVDALRAWWNALPETFHVARERDGTPAGYLQLCELSAVPKALIASDPLVAGWREHLRANPIPRDAHVLISRHYLCRDSGEELGAAQSALWMANIREAVARRPHLSRYYIALRDPDEATHGAIGFVQLDSDPLLLDGVPYTPLVLDFGPASVDGWLADLVGAELDAGQGLLDLTARQLVLDGERVDLTQLECDLLDYLRQRQGRAVRREDLLRDVWHYEWTGGSNVIEVAISSLRRKLGDRATALETVRGVGYRLRPTD